MADLSGTPFAQIRYVAETASTNADAAAMLGDREFAGSSIVAEHQTAGAGRKGRSWIAPPGTALLVTTILPEPLATESAWSVPFWAALAVRAALAACDVPTSLHWPNDLLVEGVGKIAGILCVSRVAGDTAWVACGVGINLYRPVHPATAIEPPPAYASDLAIVDRQALLSRLLQGYAARLTLLDRPDWVAREWETAAGLPGARYRIATDAGQTFEAIALGLAEGGGLIVDRDGTNETIAMADARALRERG